MAPSGGTVPNIGFGSRFLEGDEGDVTHVEEKTDYSPVVEEVPEPERRRERRRLIPALAFSWGFLAFAVALALVIVLAVYLAG
jgi:hypothetical protein